MNKVNMPKPHTTVEVTALPNCDFCQEHNNTQPAYADGKTVMGPWANMCRHHYMVYGIGFGLGKGQKYVLKTR